MKYNNHKKAVSAVVATVLIIMITVAAVGIIWAAIIPLVRNSIDEGTACFDAESDVSLETKGYTCFNVSDDGLGNKTKYLYVQVTKGNNNKVALSGLNVLVFDGGNSVTYKVNSTGLPGNGGTKVVPINISDNFGSKNISKIQVAPIVTVGSTEQFCNKVGEMVVANCAA